MVAASPQAGLLRFGSSSSSWIPTRICLTVMAGFQPSCAFTMDRQTVPLSYTFGWKMSGRNWHLGGEVAAIH